MTRPIYEASHNREAQDRVMKRLRELKGRGWKIEMTPRLSGHDGRLYCSSESRLYEVKVRHRPFVGSVIEKGGYMIGTRKVNTMLRLSKGGRWGIALDCVDGLWVMTRTKLPTDVRIDWGGRADRNDPADREMCYYIPAQHFKRLCDTVNHVKDEGGLV